MMNVISLEYAWYIHMMNMRYLGNILPIYNSKIYSNVTGTEQTHKVSTRYIHDIWTTWVDRLDMSEISHVHHVYISSIFQRYDIHHMFTLCPSVLSCSKKLGKAYFLYIFEIYQRYIWNISNISLKCTRYVSGIFQEYSMYISEIYQRYTWYISRYISIIYLEVGVER